MTEGPRPAFPFPGAWMYQGNHADYANAAVHIIGNERSRIGGLATTRDSNGSADTRRTGALDHIAFSSGEGLTEMLARLNAHNIPFREQTVPSTCQYQLFFDDPQGITVEITYPASEKTRHDEALTATKNA